MDKGRVCELGFASGRYTKASEVVEGVMKQLEIPAEMKDVFSLWMKSRNLREPALYTLLFQICTDGTMAMFAQVHDSCRGLVSIRTDLA